LCDSAVPGPAVGFLPAGCLHPIDLGVEPPAHPRLSLAASPIRRICSAVLRASSGFALRLRSQSAEHFAGALSH
jgi:hypothetical protein